MKILNRLRSTSFSAKFLCIAVGLIVLTNFIQLYRSHTVLENTNQFAIEHSQKALKDEAVNRMRVSAKELAGKTSAYLDGAFQSPSFVARQLEKAISGEYANRLSRRQVEIITRTALEGNPLISSIYVDFEADAFDGSDELYQNNYSHSVAGSGIFSLYFVRQSDQIDQFSISAEEHNLRYSEALNEFGFREGEWYLCPKETLLPCLLEPYFYEDDQGVSAYLTSLTVPIVVEAEFQGVVGVDINLPKIQALTEALSTQLYQGKTKVTLVSKDGLIVGSSHYRDYIAKPLSSVDAGMSAYLTNLDSPRLDERDNRILLIEPVSIASTEQSWTLIVEVPRDEVYASSQLIKQEIQAIQQESTQNNLLLGAIITLLGGVFIGMLVSSATKPINLINDKVEELSGAEGNLGMTLKMNTHAEFIRMSQLINKLIIKLRNMVLSLKDINANVIGGTKRVTGLMDNINRQVRDQSSNLESVACAMHQMNTTSSELAENAERAAGNSQQVRETVVSTQQTVNCVQEQIDRLTDDMRDTHEVFNRVASQSKDINQILEVIRNVSEQTNLLSLNAAIEAARAGESGRGFAVVAEEVRALALKTRSSVDTISSNVKGLVDEIENTNQLIQNSFERADQVHQLTTSAFESMDQTVSAVVRVTDDITQIANAVEEQSMVSEDISGRIAEIASAAKKLDESAQNTQQLCDQLQDETSKQDKLLSGMST